MNVAATKVPGKVMLGGEYSVLFGGIAIVAAIDRFATCSYTVGTSLDFKAITHGPEHNQHHPLFQAVIAACHHAKIEPAPGLYSLDTRPFYDGTRKIGLGSSAAAVTALVKMIMMMQKHLPDQQALFLTALKAHALFSGGLGSGADVAACVYEGLISFQQHQKHPIVVPHKNALCDKLIFIDTKRAQNTRPFVQQVMSLAQQDPAYIDIFSTQSSFLCKRIITINNGLSLMIDSIEQLYSLLHDLGKKAGIDIISAEHRVIHDIARHHGGSAKPSGAGGGDIAMALVPQAHQEACINAITQAGFTVLNLQLVLGNNATSDSCH